MTNDSSPVAVGLVVHWMRSQSLASEKACMRESQVQCAIMMGAHASGLGQPSGIHSGVMHLATIVLLQHSKMLQAPKPPLGVIDGTVEFKLQLINRHVQSGAFLHGATSAPCWTPQGASLVAASAEASQKEEGRRSCTLQTGEAPMSRQFIQEFGQHKHLAANGCQQEHPPDTCHTNLPALNLSISSHSD